MFMSLQRLSGAGAGAVAAARHCSRASFVRTYCNYRSTNLWQQQQQQHHYLHLQGHSSAFAEASGFKPQPWAWTRPLSTSSGRSGLERAEDILRELEREEERDRRDRQKLGGSGSAARLETLDDMLEELAREEERERLERQKLGLPEPEDEDDDYMGLGKIPDEKDEAKGKADDDEEDEDDDEDEDFDEEADDVEDWDLVRERQRKEKAEAQERFKAYQDLCNSFSRSRSFDEAYQWMQKIEHFEHARFERPLEYRVIGWLMNKLRNADSAKQRFLLLMKAQRAFRQVELKAAFDPKNRDNWQLIQRSVEAAPQDAVDEREKDVRTGAAASASKDSESESDADDDENRISDEEDEEAAADERLHAQLTHIDREIKRRLADMETSFGRDLRKLEDEIRQLIDDRDALTGHVAQQYSRKGFEAKLIDLNRTCKVTKGGQVARYSAIVACGNYNGIVGYAKAKGPGVPVATERAYAKTFKNLQYVERYQEHTIPHAIQAKFKKTKIYLWPSPMYSGMKANKYIQPILKLAGYKNIRSKVIGSRNPYNTVKALFIALNSIETPKDIQDKFGRTVVESYLLK